MSPPPTSCSGGSRGGITVSLGWRRGWKVMQMATFSLIAEAQAVVGAGAGAAGL